MRRATDLKVGTVVCSKAGRDKGRFFAVVSLCGEYAEIANGALRKISAPKRKKLRHLAPTSTVLESAALSDDKQLYDAISRSVGSRQKEE